jgi:DNA-binding transcriptional LysR family regulator
MRPKFYESKRFIRENAARGSYNPFQDSAVGVPFGFVIFIFDMNDGFLALRLFVRIARLRSFSRAGRELGLPQPSASRIIAALEREIGAALLTRTTRAVILTEAGVARIEPILHALDEANYAARGTGELRGVLRVGLSSDFAVREVIPRLPAFMERHPALHIDLLLEDRQQDLVTEGVDVALRFGPLADSTATARRVGSWPRILVASPDYLAKTGELKAPSDLSARAVIAGPSAIGSSLLFSKDGRIISVQVGGPLTVTVHEGAIAAAVAGLGIVFTSLGSCRSELKDGTLLRALPDWDLGSVELHALLPSSRAKPSARAFTEFLVAELR